MQSVFLEDMPIQCASFCGRDGGQVVAAGRRKFFYVHDLEKCHVERVVGCFASRQEKSFERFAASPIGGDLLAFIGDGGTVPLVSVSSRSIVGGVQIGGGGSASCVAFKNETELIVAGRDGMMSLWDLRLSGRCLGKFGDEGGSRCTSLALSPDEKSLAIGSEAIFIMHTDRRTLGISASPQS